MYSIVVFICWIFTLVETEDIGYEWMKTIKAYIQQISQVKFDFV